MDRCPKCNLKNRKAKPPLNVKYERLRCSDCKNLIETWDEGEIAVTRILRKEIVWTHELAEKLIAKHGDVLA